METIHEKLNKEIDAVVEKYVQQCEQTGSAKFSTCDHSAWSPLEWQYKNVIARRLIERGYSVKCNVNWGVTDYSITAIL